MSSKAWIGVDLDGTLAYYDGWKGSDHIGDPVPAMVQRIQHWVRKKRIVKIFTARVAEPDFNPVVIQDWLEAHGMSRLEVTNVKDKWMIQLWDDRAVQVERNTGRRIGDRSS